MPLPFSVSQSITLKDLAVDSRLFHSDQMLVKNLKPPPSPNSNGKLRTILTKKASSVLRHNTVHARREHSKQVQEIRLREFGQFKLCANLTESSSEAAAPESLIKDRIEELACGLACECQCNDPLGINTSSHQTHVAIGKLIRLSGSSRS